MIRRRFLAPIVLLIVASFGISGCSADPAALALPGSGVSGSTYTIHIEFENVLNLPSRAQVQANGAHVGELQKVTVVDPSADRAGSVVADVSIQDTVKLPRSTTVQLRQDTILGDIHLSLIIPANPSDGAVLAPGDTIPVTQTKTPVQIEDLLSVLATFVSGGSIRSAQDAVMSVNSALPVDPADTARIFDVLKSDIIDVASDTEGLDSFLDGISITTNVVLNNTDSVNQILTPSGVVKLTDILDGLIGVIGVIGAIGGIAEALVWISPLVTQGSAAARAFVPMLFNSSRPLNLDAPSNLNALVSFLRDKLIPWSLHPVVDVTDVDEFSPGDPEPIDENDRIDAILDTLRMIGLVQ